MVWSIEWFCKQMVKTQLRMLMRVITIGLYLKHFLMNGTAKISKVLLFIMIEIASCPKSLTSTTSTFFYVISASCLVYMYKVVN